MFSLSPSELQTFCILAESIPRYFLNKYRIFNVFLLQRTTSMSTTSWLSSRSQCCQKQKEQHSLHVTCRSVELLQWFYLWILNTMPLNLHCFLFYIFFMWTIFTLFYDHTALDWLRGKADESVSYFEAVLWREIFE